MNQDEPSNELIQLISQRDVFAITALLSLLYIPFQKVNVTDE